MPADIAARKWFLKQTLTKIKHEPQDLFEVLRTDEVHFEAKNEKGLTCRKRKLGEYPFPHHNLHSQKYEKVY